MWEGVGDRTELQSHSIGHSCVSFPFSWAAQPGAWGPSLSVTCSSIQHLLTNWSDLQLSIGGLRAPSAGFLYRIFSPTGLVSKLLNRWPEGSLCWVLAFSTAFSPTGLVSKLTDFLSSPSSIIVHAHVLLVGVTILHSFNLSTVTVIISWSTGCTCYLHRCISYFDSPAGS